MMNNIPISIAGSIANDHCNYTEFFTGIPGAA